MSDEDAAIPRVPVPWESRVRKLLKGEIDIEEALRLPPADRTEGYDPELFRADLKLLNNLNEVYSKTKSWRLIEFSMGLIGGPGRILYLGHDHDWESYAAIAENEERLITPMELRESFEEDELLGIDLDVDIGIDLEPSEPGTEGEGETVEVGDAVDEAGIKDAVSTEVTSGEASMTDGTGTGAIDWDDGVIDRTPIRTVTKEEGAGTVAVGPPPRPGTMEEGRSMLSTKTLVLGRSAGFPYDKVCEELSRERGEAVVLTVEEYCDHVKERRDTFDIRRECSLQLGMELQTVDEILMRLERSRDKKERTALALEIRGTSVRYHFVKGQRMYSCAYMEAYPDQFPLEAISKFNTKIKCEGDCLACDNFMLTLVKTGPRIVKLS